MNFSRHERGILAKAHDRDRLLAGADSKSGRTIRWSLYGKATRPLLILRRSSELGSIHGMSIFFLRIKVRLVMVRNAGIDSHNVSRGYAIEVAG